MGRCGIGRERYTAGMPSTEKGNNKEYEAVAWTTRRERLRLECRECEVICERVVSPWECLRSRCPYVYSYEEGETAYFGCLYKVFLPELDLAAFLEDRTKSRRGSDPYGPLRVSRLPRPECHVTIEQAYETHPAARNCCNPTFYHEPAGLSGERIRLTAKPSQGPNADSRPDD